MLDFWYSERCTRQIKLITSIVTCVIIYYCSSIEKLSPIFTLLSLAIGIAIHIFRNLSLKITTHHAYARVFKLIFLILPLLAFAVVVYFLPIQNKLWTSIQSFGFVALGLFVVSIYTSRQKRFE